MADIRSIPLAVEDLADDVSKGLIFAVLDSCDTPSVLDKVQELGPDRACSLYDGEAAERHRAIAPYLVRVDADLASWISDALEGQPWGFFALADQNLEALRKHFRRFLVVQSPEGEDWYFRFYDPRVLRGYLETATPEEAREFFGVIQAFGLEADMPRQIVFLCLPETRVRIGEKVWG